MYEKLNFGKYKTYEEVRVVGDVVAEHDETVLAIVNTELHLGINTKVLNMHYHHHIKVNITVA